MTLLGPPAESERQRRCPPFHGQRTVGLGFFEPSSPPRLLRIGRRPARHVLERNAAHMEPELEWVDRTLGELQRENIVAGHLMSWVGEPEGTDE